MGVHENYFIISPKFVQFFFLSLDHFCPPTSPLVPLKIRSFCVHYPLYAFCGSNDDDDGDCGGDVIDIVIGVCCCSNAACMDAAKSPEEP